MEQPAPPADIDRNTHSADKMRRLRAFMLAGMIVRGGGCTRATFGFRPPLISQVPDSTIVPVRYPERPTPTTGRAFGWQTREPRVVTSVPDTIDVSQAAILEVRLRAKTTHATLGAIVGLLVGLSIKLVQCPPTDYCAPDATPAVTAGVGALIGSRFTSRGQTPPGRGHSRPGIVIRRPLANRRATS